MKPLPVIEKIKNLLRVALNVQIGGLPKAVSVPLISATFVLGIVPFRKEVRK